MKVIARGYRGAFDDTPWRVRLIEGTYVEVGEHLKDFADEEHFGAIGMEILEVNHDDPADRPPS